jgi:phenylalanyl-tRNA synthetase beta chain
LGINQYEFVSLEHPLFKKGCGGSILIKGIPSGVLLGEIEGKILSNYDINQEVFFAQVCVERLFPFVNLKRRFLPFSAYPAIYRDISLVLKEGTPSLEAVKIIREIAKSYLDNVQLIDCYQGDQIPEGFKGLTFRVGYRRLDQTLRDEEIDKIQEKITLELEKRLAVKIR